MYRDGLLLPPQEVGPHDNQDRKKEKKRQAAAGLVLAPPVEPGEVTSPPPKKEPTALDRAFARLMVQRGRESRAVDTKSEPEEAVKPEHTEEQHRDDSSTEKHVETGDEAESINAEAVTNSPVERESEVASTNKYEDGGYKPLPRFEFNATEFVNGGEVIIPRGGSTPVEAQPTVHEVQAELVETAEGRPVAYEAQAAEIVEATEAPTEEQPAEERVEATTIEPTEYVIRDTVDEHLEAPRPDLGDLGAGGGEVPPVGLSETLHGEPPEEPPRHPSVAPSPGLRHQAARMLYGRLGRRGAARAVATPPAVVTRRELDNAVHDAYRDGQRRGVGFGLLVAGYEHFKHKRREKKAEKRYQAQGKKLEKTQQEHRFALEEQQRQRNVVERRLSSAERQLHGAEREQRLDSQARIEKRPISAPEQATPVEQQPNIPPEHRLESSAWHTIEVDAKTGRPVEAPTFQYGHEYYRERAQENAPVEQRNAVTGGVALVGTTQSGDTPSGAIPASLPSDLPDATMQGPPPSASQEATPKPVSKSFSNTSQSSAPLWPWLLALVVIVISLVLALH